MIPYFTIELPKIFGLPIQIFGVMVAIGFLVGDHLVKKRTLSQGLDVRVIQSIVMICIFVGLISAHVFDSAFYEPRILFTDFREFLDFRTRLSSMGGTIGAAIGCWIYLRRKSLPFLPYADVVTFGYVPGWFFGRIGCFLVHDHPGKMTDFFLGVQFPGGTRHDLGLYDALLLGFIWIVLVLVDKRTKLKPFHGYFIAIFFVIYSVGRFGFDFLRIQESRMGSLTFAQYACILMFAIGTYLLIRKPYPVIPK
ncbi:MAG: prolipoprotein diacylglyceryl transferase [Bdellovibrionales bacterium]|nr:prolipoprotein diacylglyceryl transferase [Bdellovibrionales bacterium]